jgi:serine phosphatase RsbU (regulator of sigma subunit)
MATLLVARLEPASDGHGRVLHWASAGHPPPLVTTPDGQAHHLEGESGLPLGVDPDHARPDHTCRLQPGSTVVLYTDGLVEARGEALDDGMDHTAAIAGDFTDAPPDDLCDALIAARSPTRHDDIALLVARMTP